MEKIHIDELVLRVEEKINGRRIYNSKIIGSKKEQKKLIVVLKPDSAYDSQTNTHPLQLKLMKKGIFVENYQIDVDTQGGYNGNIILDFQKQYNVFYD